MAGVMEVDNTWIFESKLGSGGFGIVQLWRNTRNGEKIATKICKPGTAESNPRQNERWIDEISIMNHLDHPNIVSTIQPVPDEIKNSNPSLPVLCMEYCRKGDLRRALNEVDNCCGMPETVAIQIIKDISGAVEYLHSRKLTHRDLKPENVVLQQINDKVIYKLIDLGYAKELGHDSVYASIVGTLNYVAPELLWKQKYTCTVDYWSLGILFYEIITGFRPFLPNEQNFFNWRKHIETKSYEDICAEYVNGDIVFRQEIQDPTDMAPCIRESLVAWFRIVLQWDSKKRGKSQRDNGTDEIVVFKMLKLILTKKIIHIFCVSQYKIYSYLVDDNTTLITLQTMIQRDTQINISSQELIDNSGHVVNNDIILKDNFLTLFIKEGMTTQLMNLPPLNLPPIITRMLEMPQAEIGLYELKRCYSAAMILIKKEVDLFKYYILGLSMKIDLINSRFDILSTKNEEMINGIHLLTKESNSISQLLQSDIRNGHCEWKKEIQKAIEKRENISDTVNALKSKINQFSRIRDTLTEFGDVDWITEYQEFLNDSQDVMKNCKTLPGKRTHKPLRMAKLIVRFLKFRQTQMKDPKLGKIENQIGLMTTSQATGELLKLEKFVDSAMELTNVYRNTISNLHKKWENEKQAESNSDKNIENMDLEFRTEDTNGPESSSAQISTEEMSSVSSDTVIYDNLVIRYMMHDIMSDTYESFLQITNLDP